MAILFYFLFLATFFCLVAGVIDPKIFTFLFGKKPGKLHIASVYIVFIIAAAVFFIIYNITFHSSNQHSKIITDDESKAQLNSVTEVSKDSARPTIYVVPTK